MKSSEHPAGRRPVRGECLAASLHLVVLASMVCAQEPILAIRPREAPAGWHLSFEDAFERDDLGDGWVALDGEWKLEKGRLTGHGQVLIANRFIGDQRLEFDAGSPKPGDLSAVLAAGDEGFKTGVFFGYASNDNTKSKILVHGREVAAVPVAAEPNRGYHVVCQRKGDRVSLAVDGRTILEQAVADLPADPGHARLGLYLWRPGWVDNVKVYVGSARAAAQAQNPGFTELRSDDLRSLSATDDWRPAPARTGWQVRTQGQGRVCVRPGAGIDGATALEVFRPSDSITSLFWAPGHPGRVNTVRLRVSAPSADTGVNAVLRTGRDYLTDLRLGGKEGIQLRVGGGAWGRHVRLVKPLEFRTNHWYRVEQHLDFERNMVRIRIDDSHWTDWTPLLKSCEADRIDEVYLYAFQSPAGLSYRLGGIAAGHRSLEDVNTLVYQTRGDRVSNTLCLEMKLLDEQGEAELMISQGDTPVSALLFNGHEITLYTARGDGARAPLLRGAAVGPGKRYRVEIQHDFDHSRVRGRVNGRSWCRWFAFVDNNTAGGFDRVSATTYSPEGNPETLLLTRLYAKHLDVPPLPQRDAAVSQAIRNGGFETLLPGIIGDYPDHWIVERSDRGDEVRLITDPATSRGGRRHLLVQPAGDEGVRVHNITYGGLKYEPGVTYRFELWVRATGDQPASITVDPGNRTLDVASRQWTHLTFERLHPMTAEPKLGFRIQVKGGPVAIDDVSALPKEVASPPATRATDWAALRALPATAKWSERDTERVVIGVANPGKTDAAGVPIELELRQLWHTHHFSFVTPDRLRVVDGAAPEKTVLWSLQEADGCSGPTPRDRLVLAVDCPGGAVKQYHVYLAGRLSPRERAYLPTKLPDSLKGATANQLEVRLLGREGRHAETRRPAKAARGGRMWGAPAIARLMPDAEPRPGPLRIAAARGERESFQICLEAPADGPLVGVRLEVAPFTPDVGGPPLTAEAIRIWSQELVLLPCGNASVNGTLGGYKWNAGAFSRVGEHPDPLLPWLVQDLAAGSRKAAWITLRVPRDARAGLYTGRVVARCAGADTFTLPIELEVFGFDLPRRRRFVPALGADPRGRLPGGVERGQVAMDVAVLLAERGMAPWTYGMKSSAYSVPWTYDPKSGKGTFDFSMTERNLPRLQKLDLRYLFFNFRCFGAGRVGRVFDTGGEEIRVDTERGRAMWRTWIQHVGGYLNARGWRDRAVVYIADEIEHQVDEGCRDFARLIHSSPPGMKTWALSAATGQWWEHLTETDIFGGSISKENLERFRKQGGKWWGVYNRPWMIGSPLWTTRVIGLHSFLMGATGYAHWAVAMWENRPWVNAGMVLRGEGANPTRGGRALAWGMFAPGMGCLTYPWPDFQGAPARGDHSSALPSIRLEALAEGIDDYEYAALLAESIASWPDAEAAQGRALMQRLSSLVEAGNLGGDFTHRQVSHGVFVVDEHAFVQLRTEIGRFLGRRRER